MSNTTINFCVCLALCMHGMNIGISNTEAEALVQSTDKHLTGDTAAGNK